LLPDFSKELVAVILKNIRRVLKMKTTYSLKKCEPLSQRSSVAFQKTRIQLVFSLDVFSSVLLLLLSKKKLIYF